MARRNAAVLSAEAGRLLERLGATAIQVLAVIWLITNASPLTCRVRLGVSAVLGTSFGDNRLHALSAPHAASMNNFMLTRLLIGAECRRRVATRWPLVAEPLAQATAPWSCPGKLSTPAGPPMLIQAHICVMRAFCGMASWWGGLWVATRPVRVSPNDSLASSSFPAKAPNSRPRPTPAPYRLLRPGNAILAAP